MADHPMSERLADLEKRKEAALAPGTDVARQRQHDRGKLLARERIDLLLDPGSFHELDLLARRPSDSGFDDRPYTDGVICGWGTVDGRKVFVFSQDFTVFGGALGEVFADKIHKLMDLALKVGAPVVGLNDGAGARIQEGVVSLDRYGGIFFRNASGALMLAYVASGRLIGYVEEHMNAWDCIAGMLLVEEAGGRIVATDPATVLEKGTMVIAGGAGVFDEIKALAGRAYGV